MIEVVDIGQPSSVQTRRRNAPVQTTFGEVPESVQRRRELSPTGRFLSASIDIGQPRSVQRRRGQPGAGTFVQGLSQIPASVQARRRLPGPGTYVSDVDDDQVMLLEDFREGLGLVTRPTMPTGPQEAVMPGRLRDGPQVQIGPFMFSADRDGPFSFSASFSLMLKRPDVKALGQWTLDQVGRISTKLLPATGPGNPAGQQWTFKKLDGEQAIWGFRTGLFVPQLSNYPNRDSGSGIVVGKTQLWSTKLLSGEKPVAKFKHPKKNEDWGVFCKIGDGKFTWTFKKVNKSWWGRLWDWLKSLVARLVDFIQDVFRALKAGVCMAAQTQLEKLAVSAEGKVKLPESEKLALSAATGVPPQAIDQVASEPTSQLARDVGAKVIAAFCKPEPGPPSPGPTEPVEEKKKISIAPLLLIGGAATALVLLT